MVLEHYRTIKGGDMSPFSFPSDVNTPQTSMNLPQTSMNPPQTSMNLPQTSMNPPQTSSSMSPSSSPNLIVNNPHISLIFLPIVVYSLIYLYGYFRSKVSPQEYVFILVVSFLLFSVGLYRFSQTSKLFSVARFVSYWLMLTSFIAIVISLYKTIIYTDKEGFELDDESGSEYDSDTEEE